MGRVEGLVALVTGAAQGLGLADAELLAAEGAMVVLTDINAEKGKAAAEAIGAHAFFMAQDVGDPAQWQAVIAETVRRFGRLDILVNNAGLVLMADIEETTPEQFRHVNRVMNDGVFLGCKYAIPAMAKSGGGSIINVASVASYQGYPLVIAYAAAKGAVRAMTKAIAVHCQNKNYGIRVNAILPGNTETEMVQTAYGRGPIEIPDGPLAAGAVGAPKDIANLVLYLASPESRMVNGTEIVIDNASSQHPFMPRVEKAG